jgi:tetratricopeptide (TPR) repeat protein
MLDDASDPSEINNIAYVLADAGSSLSQAEAAQTKAISQLDSESADWTLDGDLRPLLQKVSQKASAWDTMGWILCRQGRYDEALAYIQAALHSSSRQEIRDHFTTISIALHRTTRPQSDQELRTFALGAANGRHGVSSFNLLIADGKIVDSRPLHDQSSSTPTLEDPQPLLQKADLHSLFPQRSKAQLVRNGFLNCHTNVCELVLSPLP